MKLFESTRSVVEAATVRITKDGEEVARGAFARPPASRLPYYHKCGTFITAPKEIGSPEPSSHFDGAAIQLPHPSGGWKSVNIARLVEGGQLAVGQPAGATAPQFSNGTSFADGYATDPNTGKQTEKRVLLCPLTILPQKITVAVTGWVQDRGGKFVQGELSPVSPKQPHLLEYSVSSGLMAGSPIVDNDGNLLAIYHGSHEMQGEPVNVAICACCGLPDETKPYTPPVMGYEVTTYANN